MKAPLGSPELPRAEIIAACYAALEPSEPLWAKYLAEIDKLKQLGTITPRDHELLRFSLRAREELMDLTLGSEDALLTETIPEILGRIKSEIIQEQVGALEAERSSHAVTQEQLATAIGQQDRIRKRVHWIAARIGRGAGWAALIFLAALVLFVAAMSALYVPFVARSEWGTFATVIVGFSAIITVLNVVWGVSARMVSERVEAWAGRLSATILASMLLSETTDRG